jgi:hypothetical protein
MDWAEATVIGVPFIAAVVYLVIELGDLKVWWKQHRQPKPPPEYHPRMKDTWPDHMEMECSDEWERMLEEPHES